MATVNSGTGTRDFPRRAVHPPVSMELVGMALGPGRSMPIECRCVDISSAGIGMITNSSLHKGEVLKLHFAVPKLEVTLPVLTEVIWTRQVDDHFRVGLQFLG